VRRAVSVLLALAAVAGDARAQPSPAAAPRSPRVRDALHGDALASFDRGSALFTDGDLAGARAEFDRAHTLGGDPRVLYNVAVCDKALHRYARALRELRLSLAEGGATLPRAYVQTVQDTIAVLGPLVTALTLNVDEDGAAIYVDDEPVGVSPLAEPLPVEVGEHVIEVRKPEFHAARTRIQSAGSPTTLSLQLEPLLERGELTVRTTALPAGVAAVAVIDGAVVGPTPWSGLVPAGLHTITVRAPGFVGDAVGRDVPFRGHAEVAIDLRPQRHEGRLRATSEDADIYLDGRLVGRGQYDAVVPAGEHTLRLTRAGAVENATDVIVHEGETRSVSIQLAHRSELPVWAWIAGGVVVAGGATAAVLLLTEKTRFDGKSPGTLSPGVVPAGFRFGGL
jgi:hypothetical protein